MSRYPTSPFGKMAAALVGLVALAPVAAQAQAPAYYVATPEAAPARPSLVTRSTLWQVAGDSYVAAKAPERDAILCEVLVQKVGRLSGFAADGKAFDADALAKCNARAK